MLSRYFNNDLQKIILLRHGELDTGNKKLYVGQADVPLSAAGLDQARNWAWALKDIPLSRIITSDLRRCHTTAAIIAAARNMSVAIDKQWREISFGDWDGLDFAEVQSRFPDEVAARYQDYINVRPPNGENFHDLSKRTGKAFSDVLPHTNCGNVLIVTHAGVIRTLLAQLLNLPTQNLFSIYLDFACLNIIDVKDETVKHVRAVNLLC